MIEPDMIWAGAFVFVAAMVCICALRAWGGWLELKRLQIASAAQADDPRPAARIEMADLKERLRKLEAIAKGVDL